MQVQYGSLLEMITFDKVTKKFDSGHMAIQDLCLEVEKGEILVLLGRSGSGKTTTLRLINRLIEPTSGDIFFEGRSIKDLDPILLRRKIGYAIQHIGLFSHMTVEENIGIVPGLLKWPEEKIKSRVDELLEMVGLSKEKFRKCYPSKLSGGQKQRIGVARALAADPPVILMDEPFGALDPLMREQMQNEFLEIQSKIKKTIVFVTHDMNEAMKMGDRIAVFEKGRLAQIAKAQDLLENPENAIIDRFFGMNQFHLLLQSKLLKDVVKKQPDKKRTPSYHKLSLDNSLIEAMQAFKQANCEQISLYDQDQYVGELQRKELMETLFEIL